LKNHEPLLLEHSLIVARNFETAMTGENSKHVIPDGNQSKRLVEIRKRSKIIRILVMVQSDA